MAIKLHMYYEFMVAICILVYNGYVLREKVRQVGSILGTECSVVTALKVAWRADCRTRDLVCRPLVSVLSWFRLPNQDGFFYPTHTPVRLFIHHFIPQVIADIHQVTIVTACHITNKCVI